jgi:acetyl esterase/lipase
MHTVYYTNDLALDVYPSENENATVLLILHGGGFLIGHKGVLSSIATILNTEHGYTVVVPNYTLTKFDTGELLSFFTVQVFFTICLAVSAISKIEYVALCAFLVFIIVLNIMLIKNNYSPHKNKHPCHVHDVMKCISWVHKHISLYSGDPKSIYIMGHSAGGFLSSLAACDTSLLRQFNLSQKDIKGVICISGVFSFQRMVQTFLGRRLAKMVFGKTGTYSFPVHKVQSGSPPPHFIINATYDYTLKRHTLDMVVTLREKGAWVQTAVFQQNSHFSIHRGWGNKNIDIKTQIVQFISQINEILSSDDNNSE